MQTAVQPTQFMPASDKEAELKSTIGQLVEASKQVVIVSHVDLSQATDLCKAIKQRLDEAEDARTAITEPINKGLRELNARFKGMTEPLRDAERAVKAKMVQFQDAYERKQREEAARQERERQEKERQQREETERKQREEAAQAASDPTYDRAPAPQVLPPATVEASKPIEANIRKTTFGQSGAASTFKKQWVFEIQDQSKIPNMYMTPDSVKINNAIKAGIREIPGVVIFERTVASVK